jgi:hypothetical protein
MNQAAFVKVFPSCGSVDLVALVDLVDLWIINESCCLCKKSSLAINKSSCLCKSLSLPSINQAVFVKVFPCHQMNQAVIPDPSISLSTNSKKNIDFYCFVTSF